MLHCAGAVESESQPHGYSVRAKDFLTIQESPQRLICGASRWAQLVGAYRVQLDHLFGGSAIAPVDREGRVRLPRFVRETAGRRSEDRMLVLGPHEADPCLTGYDRPYRRFLFADTERLRLHGEAAPAEAPRRARRPSGPTDAA